MNSGRPLTNHAIRKGEGVRRRRGRGPKESPNEVKGASSRVVDSVDIAGSVYNVDRGQGEREAALPSYHDGLIEVVAVEGVLHLGQIQVRACLEEPRARSGVVVGVAR